MKGEGVTNTATSWEALPVQEGRVFPQPDNRLEVENGDRRVVWEFAQYENPDNTVVFVLELFERLARLVVLGGAE